LKVVTIFAAFFSIEAGALFVSADESGFARSLYVKGDYYRAITEYKRSYFHSKEMWTKRWANYRIGECYRKSGRPLGGLSHATDAVWFGAKDELTDSCVVSLAKSYIELGEYYSARGILDSLENESDTQKTLLRGWTYLLESDYQNARALFLSAGADSLAALSLEGENIRDKSPLVAGILSAAIPGSGQVYAGAYKQGIVSLLLHGIIGYFAYEGVRDGRYFETAAALYTGVSRFYVSNILSASRLVREGNEKKRIELAREARRRHGDALR
jgi:hypothetical protein